MGIVRTAKMGVYTGSNDPTTTVATSSTNTYYSEIIAIGGCQSFSFQVEWANVSAMTGTLYVDVSNDPDALNNPTAASWVTTAVVFPANPAGSTSATAETYSNSGYAFARVKYVNSSGTGTLGPVHANAQ